MTWEKTGRKVYSDGGADVYYQSGDYSITSRKRPIEHANRSGFWMYTSYWLLKPDGTEKEYHSLKDAKAAAEEANHAAD